VGRGKPRRLLDGQALVGGKDVPPVADLPSDQMVDDPLGLGALHRDELFTQRADLVPQLCSMPG